MIQLAFILVSYVIGLDTEEELLSKKIGACWIKTINDINSERENMGKIIQSIENANKTQIFHKIQMSMILQCEQQIDINQENYLSLTYKDVVPKFSYNQYIQMEPILTSEEETLLKIIKKLEKDLGELDKQNKIKTSYKQTEKIEDDWSKAWKDNKADTQLLTKPNYFHYAFFVVLLALIFGGGYWSLQYIQNMNKSNVQKQKKQG